MSRVLAGVVAAVAVLTMTGCTGLPTSGQVNVGLSLEDGLPDFDPNQIASGPTDGASPQDIVAGFLEAGVTPTEGWSTARLFLTPEFANQWRADAGVTIDASLSSRSFETAAEDENPEEAEADVAVTLDQVAGVDDTGAYTPAPGTAKSAFHLVLNDDGQWRISEAPDGIVLDADSFEQVYDRHVLQYFDVTWSRLVPDVRWFPRRASMATAVTQALVSGQPSPWLASAVRTAFTGDVRLARDAVPVDPSQVAEVALDRAALAAQPGTLARMRTQLEASLAGLGVAEVRFTVDGVPLAASVVSVDEATVEPSVRVLTDSTFGTAVGDEVTPLPGLTAEIQEIGEPIASIDVAADDTSAAIRLRSGPVYTVRAGETVRLDTRANLIAPTADPYGYVWTVPADGPRQVVAWDAAGNRYPIAQGWPDAISITSMRISSDGTRVAAAVTVGGQYRIVVAAILREEDGIPSGLGEAEVIGRLGAPAQSLGWLGLESVIVLTGGEDPTVVTQQVGGPDTVVSAPVAAQVLAGARTMAWVRVGGSDGVVYAQRGSSWQEGATGVLVLATHAGF